MAFLNTRLPPPHNTRVPPRQHDHKRPPSHESQPRTGHTCANQTHNEQTTTRAQTATKHTSQNACNCDLPSAICHDQNGCAADGRRHETAKCYVLRKGVLLERTYIHSRRLPLGVPAARITTLLYNCTISCVYRRPPVTVPYVGILAVTYPT